MTKHDAEIFLMNCLLLGFVFIPLIRFCSGLFQTQLPYQYAPVVIISFIYLLITARGKYLIFAALNTVFLIYNLISTENMSSIKMQIAAFTYINSFLSIYLFFKSKEKPYETFVRFYLKPLFYTSLFFMVFCLFCLVFNLWKHPFSASISDILNYITFTRVDTPFRANILVRLNPLGAALNDIQNIQYIGPQLIISPLIAFAHILIFPNEITSRIAKVIFMTLLAVLILMTNSRAMVLTCAILIAIAVLKNFQKGKLPLLAFFLVPFPFLQYFLSEKFISGRLCQYNFVTNDLSIFGHGIGAGITQLNAQCGEPKSLERLQGIQSYCFDNIHLEFLHYFGILGYLALIIASLYFIYKFRNIYTLLLALFIYFFFSLNLNLFEIYFVPLFAVLIHFATQHQGLKNK